MFFRSIILWFFMSLSAIAQTLPEPLSDTINDFADLMSPDAEARLTEILAQGRAENGARIEDYAKALFNAWGIGDASRNDGILILVARMDREVRIALGAGYPVIWDNAAQRVIDRFMLPEFREDRYDKGIEAGASATFDLIARPYVAGNPPPEPELPVADIVQTLIVGLMVAGVGLMVFRQKLGDAFARLRTCSSCGHRGLHQSRRILDAPTKTTACRGEIARDCPACAARTIIPYTIAAKSSDSGSSGGFGGGSSSGGGATGRW